MKTKQNGCFLSIILMIACLSSCTNSNEQDPCKNIIDESNVSVNWNDTETIKEINSYETNVSVYSMNNRTDTHLKLQQKYRLSVKQIDKLRYARMDTIPIKEGEGMYSSIANENEFVMLDMASGNVLFRFPLQNQANFDINFLNSNLGLSNVDINFVKNESKRLSLDCTENKEASRLVVSIPSSLINKTNRISSKMSFDTISNTLSEIECVENGADGSTVTTKVNYLYEESNGMYINIGKVTVIDKQYPVKKVMDNQKQIYNSPDDIPTISESDYKKLKDEGRVFKKNYVKFGDSSDLSSKQTILELYEDISLNKVDDALFRTLLK